MAATPVQFGTVAGSGLDATCLGNHGSTDGICTQNVKYLLQGCNHCTQPTHLQIETTKYRGLIASRYSDLLAQEAFQVDSWTSHIPLLVVDWVIPGFLSFMSPLCGRGQIYGAGSKTLYLKRLANYHKWIQTWCRYLLA